MRISTADRIEWQFRDSTVLFDSIKRGGNRGGIDLSATISSSSPKLAFDLPATDTPMGFVSFAGRVLFASVFLLSVYQEVIEFGVDGGPAAKLLAPKYNAFANHITSHLGIKFPEVDMKHVVSAAIALKGLGGLLFIFSSSFGAYILLLYLTFATPILFDFYNYDIQKPEFVELFTKFTENLALAGALLFFLGMKNSTPRRQPKRKAPKSKTL
ncbi:hypothetical protein ZIOFF_027886 [Zingiber officinale]|uniref:HR-like lesion-inducer n=2 Tax=Zingiber officinale TaxID=94328 RepID=A0A8J5L8M8_ZINOF|nr:hypothetical protein ZIOFF_027886 [Zingiber officinale]